MVYAQPEPDRKHKQWEQKVKYVLPTISSVELREMLYMLEDVETQAFTTLLNDVDERIRAENVMEGTWGRIKMQVRGYWGL